MEKNRSNKLVLPLILSILAIIGLVGYLCYEKGKAENKTVSTEEIASEGTDTKKQVKEATKSEEENNDTAKVEETTKCNCENKTIQTIIQEKPKCYGTYYGEYHNQNSNLKYTYTLKDDGTFEADFGGVSGTRGVFMIVENTIVFARQPELSSPNSEDPKYYAAAYTMADDCSTIRIQEGFYLKKQ